MRVLVTGAQGFIGKNLIAHLKENNDFTVIPFTRDDSIDSLPNLINQTDVIVHLAGENRPNDIAEFDIVNSGLTKTLCDEIRKTGKRITLILASSTQSELDNPYGKSKRKAELAVEELAADTDCPVYIYRLPGVFGKWCKPNYNSVVATFCHNIANDLPIQINDKSISIRLNYIDDVIACFVNNINKSTKGIWWESIEPEYTITLGKLAEQVKAFRNSRNNLVIEHVGTGLVRALYSTYVSYLDTKKFTYDLPCHSDERGVFVEMLKTKDSGQFSYFTVNPRASRGGHYHHSKTEKFLVMKGKARFRFRNILNDETYEVITDGGSPKVVETVPGWTHDITNMGDDEMFVMIWANEIYSSEYPDTIFCKV